MCVREEEEKKGEVGWVLVRRGEGGGGKLRGFCVSAIFLRAARVRSE